MRGVVVFSCLQSAAARGKGGAGTGGGGNSWRGATVFVKSDESSTYSDSWEVVDQLPLWFWGLVTTLSTLVSLGLIFLLYKVRCPKCRARLRLWPANHGPPFACSSSSCPVVGRLRSTGTNRFACFPCNFDLCESCVTRKLGRSLLGSSSRGRTRNSWYFVPSTGDPTAPLLTVHEREEPPPSYQDAMMDAK